jgi:beta-lactamase class A
MTLRIIARFLVVLALALFIAQSAVAGSSYPSLRSSGDAFLQRGLDTALERLDLAAAVRSHKLAIALVDITDPHHPRVAAANGDDMMYAASLPKIAILLGAFQRAADGALNLDDTLREQMVRMIRYSSNSAATFMLRKVGAPYLADVLQSPRYALYDEHYNGGLWVGKEYGKAAAWKRDPLHNLSHGATAMQVARFYYLLETGRLVSPEASQQMKTILGNPGIHHKFVKGLESSRPGSLIYRKSGSWKSSHADSAIVERNGRRYIATALANDARGGKWLTQLIVAMDDLIFQPPTQVAVASVPTR